MLHSSPGLPCPTSADLSAACVSVKVCTCPKYGVTGVQPGIGSMFFLEEALDSFTFPKL